MTGHAVDRPVRFAGTLDVTTSAGREWLVLTRRLAWWARGGDDSFITPMLVEGVIQTLLCAARHDHSHAVAEATAARGDAAARRAVALMHAHAQHAISVPEIAEAAGIGARALEKRVLADWRRTPSALLREIRLCYARRELQQSAGRGEGGSRRGALGDTARRALRRPLHRAVRLGQTGRPRRRRGPRDVPHLAEVTTTAPWGARQLACAEMPPGVVTWASHN